jgi:hypothetical protein
MPAVAVLAVVILVGVGATGAGLLLAGATDDDSTGGGLCARIEDYGAATTPTPTIRPMPSVPADAPLSSGILEPGDTAVLGDANGPGALVRVSDPRQCERYPNLRPVGWYEPDVADRFGFVVVRVEVEVLRSGFLQAWIPGRENYRVRRADEPYARSTSPGPFLVAAGIPGFDGTSRVQPPEGFTAATDVVFEVAGGPATDLHLEYRPDNVGLDQPPTVAWMIGRTADSPAPEFGAQPPPTPGPPASGRIRPGETAWIGEGPDAYAVVAGRIADVRRYPAIDPVRDVFVEVFVLYGPGDLPGTAGPGEWRAVDGSGTELTIRSAATDPRERNLIQPLAGAGGPSGWLVIDAPADGEIRLEYRRNGEEPVLFEVLVREG